MRLTVRQELRKFSEAEHGGYVMRPTEAKFDRIIFRALGAGERVNREFRPWMGVMGKGKARVGQPIRIPSRKLRTIKAPTLVILGGKDGLVGSAAAAAKRARNIPICEIEILPQAGHIMSVDEPEFVAERIVNFLGERSKAHSGPVKAR
jgi:pimeloyl-ACP methyl ester carboxylesterase